MKTAYSPRRNPYSGRGSADVALAVGVGDLTQGRSFFFTFSLLGEWMFYGLQDPLDVTVWPGPVFAYNGLHLVTFLAFGLLSSWMASVSEKGRCSGTVHS